jgi:hypothetical protein
MVGVISVKVKAASTAQIGDKMEIKIRYVWKRKSDGHIWIEHVPLACIEGNGDTPFILQDHSLWELVSRDLYTGLTDKNGKEMYEGDIVEWEWARLTDDGRSRKEGVDHVSFFWNEDEFGWFCRSSDGTEFTPNELNFNFIEVLGNIHENPELLEDNK